VGKFTLFKGKNDQFYFNLKAGNGEIIGTSEGYTTKAAAENGIASVRRNATREGAFLFEQSMSSGKFHWSLRAANGQTVLSSQMYNSHAACINGASSVAKNADDAKLVDETKEVKNEVRFDDFEVIHTSKKDVVDTLKEAESLLRLAKDYITDVRQASFSGEPIPIMDIDNVDDLWLAANKCSKVVDKLGR